MTMPETSLRQSPVHHLLEPLGVEWRTVNGASFAVRFDSVESEEVARRTLGLCDLSGLTKLGLKGRDAAGWLAEQGVDVPAAIYETRPLAGDGSGGDGGIIARLGADEFLLEGGIGDRIVSSLSASLSERLDGHPGRLDRVEHQEATFLLVGSRANDVLKQTCAVDFQDIETDRLAMTRVAGVNCSVLRQAVDDVPAFRLWADCSYAVYLWQTLAEICESLGGRVIGAAAVLPDYFAT